MISHDVFGTLFLETGDLRLRPCWPPVLVLPGMPPEVNVSVVRKRTPNVWLLVVTCEVQGLQIIEITGDLKGVPFPAHLYARELGMSSEVAKQ